MASDGKEIRVSASPDAGDAFRKARSGADQASPSAGEAASMTSEDGESSGGCDPRVKIELDAAVALTEFAQLALMTCRGPDCRRREGEEKLGGRGRRSRKRRPRSEDVCRSSFEGYERRPSSADVQDLLSNKQDLQPQKPWRPIIKKNVKIEQYVKIEEHVQFANDQNLCKKVTEQKPASRGKPKQYLTEAEKEERRLRRIQANRESARQTIRRRQAFCEELTKKAADLSLENKSIKQEIVSAMQEYLSSLDTNKHLREQMTEIDRNASRFRSQDVKGTPQEDTLCKAGHLVPSAIQFPLVVHSGTTFAQFSWPSFMRPLDPVSRPVLCSELNPSTAGTSSLPNERWTFGGYRRLKAQLLFLPCPSTYSVNNQFSQPLPSASLSSNSSDDWPDGCLPETDLTLKLAGDVRPNALVGEPSVCNSTLDDTTMEKKSAFTETSSGTAMNGRSGLSRFCANDLTLMPILGTDESSTLNHRHFLLEDSDSRTHVSSITPCLLSRPSVRVVDEDLHQNKRFSGAAAATEARKRRKELTKLKHLHGKQLKLHNLV